MFFRIWTCTTCRLPPAALQETNAIALIELLEMLWSCEVEGANAVIDAVLLRLQQLRIARARQATSPGKTVSPNAPARKPENT